MIGAQLTEGAHLHNASLVCKAWSANISKGLTHMELDMHSDPAAWRSKVGQLQSLVRHLRAASIHVNTAVPEDMLFHNLALVQQLKGIEELRLHLRDGVDLPPAAAAAIGSMGHLTSLALIGGGLGRDAAAQLLAGLAATACAAAGGGGGASGGSAAGAAAGGAAAAAAGPSGPGVLGGSGRGGLRRLTLLPAVQHGLGDEAMGALAGVVSLEVLEFRAHRLTSAGLATLSLGLPLLTRLAITSLDSDSGYELACLERLSALAELDLALDQAPTGAASRRALCAVRPGKSLSLSFRWTDRAQGLLTEYGNHLANLTHLDVGACRVGSESLFEAVAQLTGLRELRMAVYSNADHCIPCHLSRLSALAALQRFHLEKRRAYFPEARRFGESSIAVPVTADGLRALAARWGRLRSLRLALSRKDYSQEGLSVLSSFTGLRELGIVVERFPGQSHGQGQGPASSSAAASSAAAAAAAQAQVQAEAELPQGDGVLSSSPPATLGLGLGRFARRGGVELPPVLDLWCLPAGLHALELSNLLLDLSGPGLAGPVTGLAAGGAAAGLGPAGASPAGLEAAAGGEAMEGVEEPGPGLGLGVASRGPGLGLSLGLPALDADDVDPSTSLRPALPPLPPPPASLPPPSSLPPPAPLPLSQLTSLDVETCVVRPPLLAALAARCGPSLRTLRLAAVVGLSDDALEGCLPRLPALRSLTVSAPGNRAVTQRALASLSSTRRPPLLRQLAWESDDLTSRGPALEALAPLTSLRHLHLSCTDKTAERALGSLRVLQVALPYCHVDMVWTSGSRGGPEPL
ncbi:hypothetical protein HYH03_001786 [Edaphochlamys debaryana]|uniref:Uncharacterized protein n=1 Tax=Edaphochlamys debaryana TaxID=47281 RepID=A0A835YCK5_9CHLO|nr:hypothetical protein HYH03_001786 [Edaphochlamys debaryana]|eukprot:KAG2500208.1 hypothetical protein HYH03_001786 [Edaphochlamys debaryana]